MDEKIEQIRLIALRSAEKGDASVVVDSVVLAEIFRRLAANPVKLRDYSSMDLLAELANRERRRTLYPNGMKALSK